MANATLWRSFYRRDRSKPYRLHLLRVKPQMVRVLTLGLKIPIVPERQEKEWRGVNPVFLDLGWHMVARAPRPKSLLNSN